MSPKHSNTTLSSLICNILSDYGIKDICISPGSRNTPLTVEFLSNEKFRCYSQIDERSCAFFALGISKASLVPSVILTTSGTAVANLFPGIVEAYMSKTPIIIITADRPKRLLGTGANQTTELTLFQDVFFEGNKLKAGSYSLYTIPNEKEWTIIINSKLHTWGIYGYDATKDVVRFNVPPTTISEARESFGIAFDGKNGKGKLLLAWENTEVFINLEY